MRIWDQLSDLGLKQEDSSQDRRRIRLTNRLIFICLAIALIIAPVNLMLEAYERMFRSIGIIIVLSIILFLSYKGHQLKSALLLCLTLIAYLVINSHAALTAASHFYLIPVSMFGFTLIRGFKPGFVIFFLAIAAFFTAEYFQSNLRALSPMDGTEFNILYMVNIFFVFWMSVYLIFHFKLTGNDYEADILRQKDFIEQQNIHIKDSISYASRLQEAILPPINLIKKHLPHSYIYYRPKDIIAGDFYWFDAHGEVVYLACADCTGHGVPGAMVSVVCSNALNKAVNELKINEPAEILDKVRELVIQTFEKSENEVKDGMDISFCKLNLNTRMLTYAGANNPLYRITPIAGEVDEKTLSDESHMLLEYKGDKQPIGMYAHEKPFTQKEIQLLEGDSIYMSSDGYPDQFGGEKGRKYMYKPFKRFFLSLHKHDMTDQLKSLDIDFEKWQGEHEQVDDVCVIGVKV